MFETNTDFDFDEEIFATPFEVEALKSETSKRPIASESTMLGVKRPCFDTRSAMLLKATDEDCSDGAFKPPFEAKAGRQFQSPLKQVSSSSPMKKVVLRKFPGPAGLLPERRDLHIDIKALEEVNNKESKQDTAVDMDVLCSQLSVKAFQEGPWKRMAKDFQRRNAQFLPDKYNIDWIKSKAKANKLINQKAPFLACIIQNIESSKTSIVTMLLKDLTGQIHGTIVHDLYEEYAKYLAIGSVIILKQVSVLTTDRGTNHYITITANNLVAIYSQSSTNDACEVENEENTVNVTTIQNISIEDFIQNINEVKSRHKVGLLEQNLNPERDLENILLSMRATSEEDCKNVNKVTAPAFQRTISQSATRFASPSRSVSSTDIAGSRNVPKLENAMVTPSNTIGIVASIEGTKSKVNIYKENVRQSVSHLDNAVTLVNSDLVNSSEFNAVVNSENVKCFNKSRFNFKAVKSKQSESVPQIWTGSNNNELREHKFETGNRIKEENSNKLSNTSVIKCSQISITSDSSEHSAILQNVFEGLDADSLFDDF